MKLQPCNLTHSTDSNFNFPLINFHFSLQLPIIYILPSLHSQTFGGGGNWFDPLPTVLDASNYCYCYTVGIDHRYSISDALTHQTISSYTAMIQRFVDQLQQYNMYHLGLPISSCDPSQPLLQEIYR